MEECAAGHMNSRVTNLCSKDNEFIKVGKNIHIIAMYYIKVTIITTLIK